MPDETRREDPAVEALTTETAQVDFVSWLGSLDPAEHCFREDNCAHHPDHDGPDCCCCRQSAEAHAGCDCD